MDYNNNSLEEAQCRKCRGKQKVTKVNRKTEVKMQDDKMAWGRLQGLEASPGCRGQGFTDAEAGKKVKAPWVLWRVQRALLIACMIKVPLKHEEARRIQPGSPAESPLKARTRSYSPRSKLGIRLHATEAQ